MNLTNRIVELGAFKANEIACADIPFNPIFRKACEVNSCGMYGRCWMCPPNVGEIDELIAKAQGYRRAVVYQTVSSIEDSFDIEGMLEAGLLHNKLAQAIGGLLCAELSTESWLHLGAGGCRVCERCAKWEELPCRFPKQALASLEAYGISVSDLAPIAGMKYINGQNTVTYFGTVLFK